MPGRLEMGQLDLTNAEGKVLTRLALFLGAVFLLFQAGIRGPVPETKAQIGTMAEQPSE